MVKLKVRKIGNSLGVILPKEALAMLSVDDGDEIVMSPTANGASLQSNDEVFEAAMKAFERSKKKFKNAYKELAK